MSYIGEPRYPSTSPKNRHLTIHSRWHRCRISNFASKVFLGSRWENGYGALFYCRQLGPDAYYYERFTEAEDLYG